MLQADEAARLSIVAGQLEVDDLVALDLEIIGHQLCQIAKMALIQVPGVLRDLSHVVSEKVVHDARCEDGLQMSLLVRLELFLSVQVDSERGHFHERPHRVPILRYELVAIFNDNFAGEGQIPVEPGAPQPTTVGHHVDLVAAQLLKLAARRDLQHGAVRVAPDNLERLQLGVCCVLAAQKRADGRMVSSEVVAFAPFEMAPCLALFQLSEAVAGEHILAVLHGVEVAHRGIESNENLSRVLTALGQELRRHGLRFDSNVRCSLYHLNIWFSLFENKK